MKSFRIFLPLLLFLVTGSALILSDADDWGYEATNSRVESGPVSGDFTWNTQFMIQSVRRPMIVAQLVVAAFAITYALKKHRPTALWVSVAIGMIIQLSFYYYRCHPIDSVILSWDPNVPPNESGIAGEYRLRRYLDLKLLLTGVAFAVLAVVVNFILRRLSANQGGR
jgi:hypothetical protein